MMELKSTHFPDFFQAVHGHEAFEWQTCLARKVLEAEGWPDVIRVPTGCGKTSVLDLAVFELAVHAQLQPKDRAAARRICFVVDRRLVVDEATDHACRLQRAIKTSLKQKYKDTVLRSVAERLASLAAEPTDPIRVVRLRGGVYRDDGWTADPLTPTILVSTVDQIGSRLLFRGYGVSQRSLPVHAGLLAFDTRIILDEAHLSTVFAETVDRVREYQQLAALSPVPENRIVSVVRMSATAGEAQKAFDLTDDLRKDVRLASRLEARKIAHLIEERVEPITKSTWQKEQVKARRAEEGNREKLVARLVQEAKNLAVFDEERPMIQDEPPLTVGIVVNRVATARQVFQGLRKHNNDDRQSEVILLTGRIRPYDRDRILSEWLPRIKADRKENPEHPLFVVATQTVEVGANLDFGGLITEAAPIDALRQRFGRLDRLGRRHERKMSSPALILIRSDLKSKANEDPIYGTAIAETWHWLNSSATGKTNKCIDFGINCLDAKLQKVSADQLRRMIAPQARAPVVLPAHLNAWMQTNPTPETNPDIGPFLHGRIDAASDVQLVWRADLNLDNSDHWVGIIRLMPPRTREALPLPVYELQAWLRQEAIGDVVDIEGAELKQKTREKKGGRRIVRWRGMNDITLAGPEDIKPGDTVVVPSSYGGSDEFGWNPCSMAQVADVAEVCLAQLIGSYPATAFKRPKFRIRLHSSLFDVLDIAQPVKERLKGLLSKARTLIDRDNGELWASLRTILSELEPHITHPSQRTAIHVLSELSAAPQVEPYPENDGLVLIASVRLPSAERSIDLVEETELEDSDDDGSSLVPTGRRVLLGEHYLGVEKMVVHFSHGCGLADDLQKALALAAQWHDEGKRDRRFQAWLHGSEIKALVALASGQVLAKSGRSAKGDSRFGYPRGARHEFVSVRLFEAFCAKEGTDADDRLIRLLIGTHHGLGRPFAPVVPESEESYPIQITGNSDGRPLTVSSDHRLYRLDSGWTDLFWCMVRRYGWWGLAFLEAVLITADHFVSAQEQRGVEIGREESAI